MYKYVCCLMLVCSLSIKHMVAQEAKSSDLNAQEMEAMSTTKATVASKDFDRKIRKSDLDIIRNAQRQSPIVFLNNYNQTSKLEKPSWTLLNGYYHCLYTPKDGEEAKHIQGFIQRNQKFINQKRLKVKEGKGLEGHPQYEFYLPNGKLYMAIKARMQAAGKR